LVSSNIQAHCVVANGPLLRPRLRDRIIQTRPFTAFDKFFVPFTTTLSLNWPHDPRDCLLLASNTSPLSTPVSVPASMYSMAVQITSPAPLTPSQVSTPGTGVSVLPREEEQWLLNPAFEKHLRDLGNWSLGAAFRSAFPHFADCVTFKDGM